MKIIFVIPLFLVLAYKGPTMAAETQEEDLLQSCKSYEQFCTENNKLLRNHIELLTNSMEEMTINSCGKLYDQVKKLMANEIELQKQLESKNEQIRQYEDNMINMQQVIVKKLYSEGAKLLKCNTELESKRKALIEKDQEKTKLQTELSKSVVQNVTLSKDYTFEVLWNSDIACPGWTVIQQRINGRVDFKRDWETYRNGFGDFWDGDFFLGLEKIHRLTAEQPHELYIHMTRFDGSTYFATYDEFAISGGEDKYRMSKLGKFNGTTTDKLRYNNNMEFSTYDRDNDEYDSKNCAELYDGGWWFKSCTMSFLNGFYFGDEVNYINGIFWENLTALKEVKMMIRPKVG